MGSMGRTPMPTTARRNPGGADAPHSGRPNNNNKVVVVVAGGWDPVAQALASRVSGGDVRLLTPLDLSTAGWRYRAGRVSQSRAVVDGVGLDSRAIHGVLTRLPSISADQLTWIDPDDRAYVAAEMQAFLLAWLTELPCPVLNRPTPTCLAGPFWRHERWTLVAARLGMPVEPVRRMAPVLPSVPPALPPSVTSAAQVTVVGRQCVGAVDPMLARQARDLAAAASTELLTVWFDGPDGGARFLGATPWPDLATDELMSAVLEYFNSDDGNVAGCSSEDR